MEREIQIKVGRRSDMKRTESLQMILVVLLLFLSSCSPKEVLSPQPGSSMEVKSGEKTPVKEAWEAKWDAALQAARKEGKVVIYATSIGPTLKSLAPRFRSKFGFDLEVVPQDKGAAMVAKMYTERRAGLYIPDVAFSGTNTFFGEIKPSGLADPVEPLLILPEVLDPNVWYGGKLPWGDKEHLIFMSYAYPNVSVGINSDLVMQDEIKSYHDILNPKWKGKILMNDPTLAGTGLKSFSVLAFHYLNLDYFKQLARLEPMIVRDQRLQVDWLARGKYAILFFPRTTPMTEFRKAGAPVALVSPIEGTYLSSGSAMNLTNKAPHLEAARVFINWFLSKEGQSLTQSTDEVQSARVDISTEGIDPVKLRQPGGKYFLDADKEEWLSRDPEFTKASMDIFGQFIK